MRAQNAPLTRLTQGVPVELEAEPSGAGYLSKSVDGIAAKVLLEQAQEAAGIARKRLEKAAEYHNQVGDAMPPMHRIIFFVHSLDEDR
jgi:hypothetical protein